MPNTLQLPPSLVPPAFHSQTSQQSCLHLFSPFPTRLSASCQQPSSCPSTKPPLPDITSASLRGHPVGISQSSSWPHHTSTRGFDLSDHSHLLETFSQHPLQHRAILLCMASHLWPLFHRCCPGIFPGPLLSPSLLESSHPCLWLHSPSDVNEPQVTSPIPASLLIFQVHVANCLLDSSSSMSQRDSNST